MCRGSTHECQILSCASELDFVRFPLLIAAVTAEARDEATQEEGTQEETIKEETARGGGHSVTILSHGLDV